MVDFELAMMSEETRAWNVGLLTTSRRYGVDYYHATEKERFFV